MSKERFFPILESVPPNEKPKWPPYIELPPIEHTPITDEDLAKKRDRAFDIRRELDEINPLRQ